MAKHKPIRARRVASRPTAAPPPVGARPSTAGVAVKARPPVGWDQRVCLGTSLELWFGPPDDAPAERREAREAREERAKHVCSGCPFTVYCLQVEVAFGPAAQHGVRGGLNADERRALIRSIRRGSRRSRVFADAV